MSDIELYIHNKIRNKTYKIKKFIEYRVDIDLESDADGFQIIFPNKDGEFNRIVNRFDEVDIKLNGKNLLNGVVDKFTESIGSTNHNITVTGRDGAAVLLDNDALPDTISNVKPVSYISNKCKEYGIRYKALDNVSPTKELIIGTGESEISVMSNLLVQDRQRLWFMYDTLYSGKWSTNVKPSYTFTRGKTGISGIRIESLSYTEDGKDMKSEMRIYGSVNNSSEKVMGVAKNDYLVSKGIKRRSTKRSSNNDSSTKYSASALEDVRDSFRNNITVEIEVYTDSNFFIPNTTARVVDKLTGIDGTYFIKSVSYMKSVDSGSIATIIMIPDDPTFDVIWKNQGKK